MSNPSRRLEFPADECAGNTSRAGYWWHSGGDQECIFCNAALNRDKVMTLLGSTPSPFHFLPVLHRGYRHPGLHPHSPVKYHRLNDEGQNEHSVFGDSGLGIVSPTWVPILVPVFEQAERAPKASSSRRLSSSQKSSTKDAILRRRSFSHSDRSHAPFKWTIPLKLDNRVRMR